MKRRDQFAPRYGRMFDDRSVVDAYPTRPPYPPETADILVGLAAHRGLALDAGCGPGLIARVLADDFERVDAVDPSGAMIKAGRAMTSSTRIRWFVSTMEDVALEGPYDLIVTAASLHWMHWETVLPKFRRLLAPGAVLAIVGDVVTVPWRRELSFINEFSLNSDFEPYSMDEIVADLETLGLFRALGRRTTGPVVFEQSIDDYVESFHARNGLSRDRMEPSSAAAFDDRVRAVVQPHCTTGRVFLDVSAHVMWGEPL